MSKGFVYVLTNEAMPGLVKIGRTSREVHERAREVSQSSGVPVPFTVQGFVASPDCVELERRVHTELNNCRVSVDREFFKVEPCEAVRRVEEEQYPQIYEWVEGFLPDHVLVRTEEYIDGADLRSMASDLGVGVEEISLAFHLLRPEDFAPAIQRWRQRRASTDSKNEDSVVIALRESEA